jgi:hypothetical protein
VLSVQFPGGDWSVSGFVGKSEKPAPSLPPLPIPQQRPAIAHEPVRSAAPNQPLHLTIRVSPPARAALIRLHYRAVNQLVPFKTLESRDGDFTIPAADVSPNWDLMYYFEILNPENTGWFEPDPHTATPYYIVTITPASP